MRFLASSLLWSHPYEVSQSPVVLLWCGPELPHFHALDVAVLIQPLLIKLIERAYRSNFELHFSLVEVYEVVVCERDVEVH